MPIHKSGGSSSNSANGGEASMIFDSLEFLDVEVGDVEEMAGRMAAADRGRILLKLADLIEKFSLASVGRAAGVFNPDKMQWVNHEWLKKVPEDELARLAEGYVGWDIESLCKRATVNAIKGDSPVVAAEHFHRALKEVRQFLTPDMVQKYWEIRNTDCPHHYEF